jgi:hypothetical protein
MWDCIGACLAACDENLDAVTIPEPTKALAVGCGSPLLLRRASSTWFLLQIFYPPGKRVMDSSVDLSLLVYVTEDSKFLARTLPSCSFIHVYSIVVLIWLHNH